MLTLSGRCADAESGPEALTYRPQGDTPARLNLRSSACARRGLGSQSVSAPRMPFAPFIARRSAKRTRSKETAAINSALGNVLPERVDTLRHESVVEHADNQHGSLLE